VQPSPEKHIPVFISGDRRADLGIAVEILDRLRGAGITEVSFEAREATG
jgi:biopolymer transport protein ExbD